VLILSLALPATIFIALLKIDFSWGMVVVPLLALGFNLLMYAIMLKLPLASLFNMKEEEYRSLVILIPSLAPGLSLFPFILEYHGEAPLALAALADVGNKVFVLIILYLVAMQWYFSRNGIRKQKTGKKLKSLMQTMLGEPVNVLMVLAIAMLAMGLRFESLPAFLQLSIDRLSLMMTPLILLFIGLSVKLSWQQVKAIFSFLLFRSAIAFFISGLLIGILPAQDLATTILIVVFPQCACSFWPFAHMASVNSMEEKNSSGRPKTFDLDFGMNVLACSMPFSVILILAVYLFEGFFAQPANVFISALLLFALAVLQAIVSFALKPAYNKKVAGEWK